MSIDLAIAIASEIPAIGQGKAGGLISARLLALLALLEEGPRSIASIARVLSISYGTAWAWVDEARRVGLAEMSDPAHAPAKRQIQGRVRLHPNGLVQLTARGWRTRRRRRGSGGAP